ncbi:MAG: DUF4303 domain-containing protein [Zavarzinella sp.]
MSNTNKSKSVSFPTLTKSVYLGLKKTVEVVSDRCGDEHLYVFALWLSPTYSHVGASFNTVEALDRVVSAIGTDEFYDTAEKMRALLKWNPDDWEYHENKNDSFDTANLIMQNVSDRLRSIKGAVAFQNYVDKVDDTLVKAILRAQNEGLFDSFGDRDTLVLALVQGDTEPKWFLKNARRLISRNAYSQLRSEIMPRKRK